MAACKAPGLLNFFGKKVKPSPATDNEGSISPSVNAQPAIAATDVSTSPAPASADHVRNTASPETQPAPVVPPTESKKPLFALFQPKNSPAVSTESPVAPIDAGGKKPMTLWN